MATYEFLKETDTHAVYIVKPENFWESLKMAWYVIRYPKKTPVLMVVDRNWAESTLTPKPLIPPVDD